jgi:hypothetical protein
VGLNPNYFDYLLNTSGTKDVYDAPEVVFEEV